MSSFPYECAQTTRPAASQRPTGAPPTTAALSQVEPDISRPPFDWYQRSPVKAVGVRTPSPGEKVEGFTSESFDGAGSAWMMVLIIVIVIIAMGFAGYIAYKRIQVVSNLKKEDQARLLEEEVIATGAVGVANAFAR